MILLIESSSSNCSVAVCDQNEILAERSMAEEHYVHAEKLHGFIAEVFKDCKKNIADISAVSVGMGPGSYTGLRIGISAAKGICYSLGVPLISVSTTELLARYATEQKPGFDFYVPMIDARRMEVYSGTFDQSGQRLTPDSAIILDETYFHQWKDKHVLFVGDGAKKCADLIGKGNEILSVFPDATMLASISREKFNQREFENVAYFEPFYLKDYIPGTAKKSILPQ